MKLRIKRGIICAVLIALCLGGCGRKANEQAYVTLYSSNGSVAQVPESKVDKYLNNGWYRTEEEAGINDSEEKQTPEATKKPVETVKPKPATLAFPADFANDYLFTSGMGGWSTQITLNKDGSFSGIFEDYNLGESGTNYEFTRYVCEFTGKFKVVKQIDENSYLVEKTSLVLKRNEGEEWIADGGLHVASSPYGLEEGKNFVFYRPTTPVANLDEEFYSWWPLRYEGSPGTLSCYGIHNVSEGYGFFSME